MTGDNCTLNAAAEMARALECLREAEALRAGDFFYGAASRAYYAVFHAVRALLFTKGLEVKSHRAAISLFGEHFVKTNLLPPRLGRLVSHLQRDREDADYVVGAVFTASEADPILDDAKWACAEIQRLLATS